MIVSSMLWRTLTGAPWRDLPPLLRELEDRLVGIDAGQGTVRGNGSWTGCALAANKGADWKVGIDTTVVRAPPACRRCAARAAGGLRAGTADPTLEEQASAPGPHMGRDRITRAVRVWPLGLDTAIP